MPFPIHPPKQMPCPHWQHFPISPVDSKPSPTLKPLERVVRNEPFRRIGIVNIKMKLTLQKLS
ncbi:uncharacterized protein Dvir_GJ26816 [Drosophila virilis]|uniref:Uncharacterized protein n=1 Tax=Drosophila virilis TaxID=7244 RepID=A0A0Q9WBW6_DROVI|nr:uncharacterized protein Dvir_GJ26816 [Drosophila virilis]